MLNHSLVPVGSTGYDIPYSARFNDDDSAYLSRTPSSAGNRKTWTWSGWVKRGNVDATQTLFTAVVSENNRSSLAIQGAGTIQFLEWRGSHPAEIQLVSSAVFRDPSSWYHILLAVDASNSSTKLYVNSIEVALGTNVQPSTSVDTVVNSTNVHYTAAEIKTWSAYCDGYLAEVNFVDGQALTPADFGETDATYGHWKAKEYTGTYGTNGFYLDFKNSGSLGNDANGSNNWTPTNLVATDQMLDSPTNNFATWTVTDAYNSSGLQDGGLRIEPNPGNYWRASIAPSSGKWYYEIYNEYQHHSTITMGVKGLGSLINDTSDSVVVTHPTDFTLRVGTTTIGSYGTMGGEKVVGIAYDVDAQTISFYLDGAAIDSALSDIDYSSMANSEWVAPYLIIGQGRRVRANFGQDSTFSGTKTAGGNADGNGYGDFKYAPPTGYLALCTQNLPEPTVVPSEHFNTVLYSGTGAEQAITGVGFQPDFIWVKHRQDARSHGLVDSVRGATITLSPNSTAGEVTLSQGLKSFDADGFTLGTDQTIFNESGGTPQHVAWNWKAGGTAASNTNGTITSSVSANADAGFSIVSYTGNNVAGATIGHGLSAKPDLIIVKIRADNYTGRVYNSISGATKYLDWASTATLGTYQHMWNNTEPTSSVFSVGHDVTVGGYPIRDFIAYCFHSVEGYSKVGSYTGNGSTDGTFVHCGFRPAYVMVKKTTGTSANWTIWDNERPGYNESDADVLYANLSNSEWTGDGTADNAELNLVSNGFKLWGGADHAINGNGETYIFLAFAENPFKYTNAR